MDDFFINNKQLIAEVKKRPELYDVTDLHYYNRNNRDEKWIELFQVLVPQWIKLSPIEQQSYGLSIKKKWRSMRDSFAKDIRKRSSPSTASKSRRYIYYNQMKFILPALAKRKGPDGTIADSGTDPLQCDDDDSSIESENNAADETQSANNSQHGFSEDEDKIFLLSLLPLYKSMKKDSKLVGRIKMLEALRNVIQENCCDSVARSDKNVNREDDGDDNVTKIGEDGPSQEDAYSGAVLNSPNFSPESDVKSEPSYPFMLDTEDDPLLTTNEDSSPPPTKKHRIEHQKLMHNNSIPVVSPAPSAASTSDDIFEAIGKNVAHKLRRMEQQQRIIAEKIIGDVMYHGQMEMLTLNSHLAVDK